MTIDEKTVSWIIAGLGVLVAILTWLRTRRQDFCQDGGMRVDLEYIKRGVDRISVDMQRMQTDLGEQAVRLARVEESAKQAHKRLDEHLKLHPPD
jgi:hypothetical protein